MTTLLIKPSACTKTLHRLCKFLQKRLDFTKTHLLTPTCQCIAMFGYICHRRDILQLWLQSRISDDNDTQTRDLHKSQVNPLRNSDDFAGNVTAQSRLMS